MAEHTAHHGHAEHHHDEHEVVEYGLHHIHSSKKEIWKIFFILLGITVLEFAIALTPVIRQGLGQGMVAFIFLFLTVLKAGYIVGYFMHLKHEKLNLAYTILIPILFIVYLIALLLFEGAAQVN